MELSGSLVWYVWRALWFAFGLRRYWSLLLRVWPFGIQWNFDDLLSVDGADPRGILITKLFVKCFNRSIWDSVRLDSASVNRSGLTAKPLDALVEADGRHMPLSKVNAIAPRTQITLVFPLGNGLAEMEFLNKFGGCRFEAIYEGEMYVKTLRRWYLESLIYRVKRLLYPA